MTSDRLFRAVLCVAALIVLTVILPQARAQEPVKVFILAGQSNMVGHGKVEMGREPGTYVPGESAVEVVGGLGSLRCMVANDWATYGSGGTRPLVNNTLAQVLDVNVANLNWLVRNDVKIYGSVDGTIKKGNLTTGFGAGTWIGPEYGFGQAVGNAIDGDVLLIKMSWGGKSLAVDFLPPSAESYPEPQAPGDKGYYYKQMVDGVNTTLANLGTEFPEFAGRSYDIAGFGWHQGWNDRVSTTYSAEYEDNLVDLIHDVRDEFGKPNLPFVIGTTGMAPPTQYTTVELAQLAVADPDQHPEFVGTVATVDTRPYWRDAAVSPSNFGYHWNHNGESHYLVGDGMGEAVLTLLDYAPPPFVQVDRQTGEIRIVNPADGAGDMDLKAYSITTASEALDPAKWTPIDGHYDSDGDGSVCSGDWTVTSSTAGQFSEQAAPGGPDGLIAIGAEVSLGVGAWIQNPGKDLQATYTDTEGNSISLSIVYTGSENKLADLDFDGTVDGDDWAIFIAGNQMDLSSLSAPLAYQAGDLNGDFRQDIFDFDLFRNAFEADNPQPMAFEMMLDAYYAGVPEPASVLLLGVAAAGLCLRRRRKARMARCVRSDGAMGGKTRKPSFARYASGLVVVLALSLLAGSAGAELIINVNMYASSGPVGNQVPEDPATLAGPAGGLGETWNQFNTTGGSSLLDSTGAATSVGFTTNVGSGWIWGSPALTMLKAGRAQFTKGADTTFTITGLTAGSLYDVWLASYAHNTTPGELALGEWSTANTTTTVGPQMIDCRTGLNGATWEYGRNYVLFENVLANDNGGIILIADAADVGDYGETYATRLPLNGWQIEEVIAPATLTLQVNTVSGAMTLSNPDDAPLGINYYQISSAGNSLDPQGWISLQDQDNAADGFPAGDGTGNGWEEAGGAGPHALAEAYLRGDSIFTPGASISLGAGYDEGIDAQDLVLTYRTDVGQILEGTVEYLAATPGDATGEGVVDAADYIIMKRNFGQSANSSPSYGDFNKSGATDWDDLQVLTGAMGDGAGGGQSPTIPEPATLGLLAIGALAMLRRNRRS